MDQVPLGRTRVQVTRLGFGAAVIGGLFAAVDDDTAQQTLQAGWDVGIRYFDTAPHYGAGLSEQRLGRFLRGVPREEFTISTKVGRRLVADPRAPTDSDGFVGALRNVRVRDYSADGVRRQLDQSLQRLGLDRVDVVYVHDPDDHWQAAVDGAFPALTQLREQGSIGAIGAGMNQWQMPARLLREFDLDAVMLAGRYTLLDQSSADEFLPLAHSRGVSVVAVGVFNSGVLTNPRPGAHYDYAEVPPDLLARALRLREVCQDYGVPLAAAAAQFPLLHPAVTSIVLGSRNPEQVRSGATLLDVPIPSELWTALTAEGVRLPDGAAPAR